MKHTSGDSKLFDRFLGQMVSQEWHCFKSAIGAYNQGVPRLRDLGRVGDVRDSLHLPNNLLKQCHSGQSAKLSSLACGTITQKRPTGILQSGASKNKSLSLCGAAVLQD